VVPLYNFHNPLSLDVVCHAFLGNQTKCFAFADPYVEHDSLTLLIDLILLKRGVYRHLLYNRGTEARRASGRTGKGVEEEKDSQEEIAELPDKRERVRECAVTAHPHY
jgi:Predicted membrane protein